MFIPLFLLFVVSYARPIGPIPPEPIHQQIGTEVFETPLLTDLPIFSSPDDFDPSFTPFFPESSLPIESPFSLTPSLTPSQVAPTIPPHSAPPLLPPSSSATPTSSPASSTSLIPTPSTSISPSSTPSSQPQPSNHEPSSNKGDNNSKNRVMPSTNPTFITPTTKPLSTVRETPPTPSTETTVPKMSATTSPAPSTETTVPKMSATTSPAPSTETTVPKMSATTSPTPSTEPTAPNMSATTSPTPKTPMQDSPRVSVDTDEATQQQASPTESGPGAMPPMSALPSQTPFPPPVSAQRTPCFPATAIVTLVNGSQIPMSRLEIGHVVQVGPSKYSTVHMFTHRVYHTIHEFIELKTDSGHVLTLSEGHYAYVGDVLKPAREVRKGDCLPLGHGGFTCVNDIDIVSRRGLYNPQTASGDIVVNGIKASVYTEAVKPALAHAALLPLRLAFDLFGVSTQCAHHGFPDFVPIQVRSLLAAN